VTDMAIDELLESLGYASCESRMLARKALVDAGLTNERKQRIAASKVEAVKAELRQRFAVVCLRDSCGAAAGSSGRALIYCARPTDCSVCGGSANQAAIDGVIEQLRERKLHRLVVVGGSPATHEEVLKLVGERLELRLISGTDQRNSAAAKADLVWADLIVVWGGTQLDHKVSKLYTDGRDPTVVVCAKRGIEALAATLREAAMRR
jgi:hypothetical protein